MGVVQGLGFGVGCWVFGVWGVALLLGRALDGALAQPAVERLALQACSVQRLIFYEKISNL